MRIRTARRCGGTVYDRMTEAGVCICHDLVCRAISGRHLTCEVCRVDDVGDLRSGSLEEAQNFTQSAVNLRWQLALPRLCGILAGTLGAEERP